jgi:HSP20 family protein
MVLFQNDPFRDLDLMFDRMGGRTRAPGHAGMPMDAYRRGGDVWVHLDLPGVHPDSIDIDLERNVLTVSAERSWGREDGDQLYVNERRQGTFKRQVHLGDSLDAEHIEAVFNDGVLTLRIPVAEKAQPRKIEVNTSATPEAIETTASES